MEASETVAKKKQTNHFRVNLKKEVFDRISHWAEQIKGQRNGVKIRPSDLVEYILESHSAELTPAEIEQYKERYTNEIDLAKWLVKELSAAQKRGQKLSIAELIRTSCPKQSSKKRKEKQRAKGCCESESVSDSQATAVHP
ncbi:MAG: hypothetical protein HY537_05635 [Deltaproteobacteria bacterium]|nr:hypothetical protein [Deltaproteobacteria bacterium]